MQIKFRLLLFALVAVAGSLLYFYVDPSTSDVFPKCVFHALTNLDCPGCGSQRAIHALLHGQLAVAADFNLLVVLFLPFLVYSAFILFANGVLKKSSRQKIFDSGLFARIVLTCVLLFWVLRNLPLGAFRWLSSEY